MFAPSSPRQHEPVAVRTPRVRIGRANLNGSGLDESFIGGPATGSFCISVTSTNIYWTNWNNNSGSTIGRAKLNGRAVNHNFITGAAAPLGIAVG